MKLTDLNSGSSQEVESIMTTKVLFEQPMHKLWEDLMSVVSMAITHAR